VVGDLSQPSLLSRRWVSRPRSMVSVVRAPVLASAGVPVPRLWPGRARWACRTFA